LFREMRRKSRGLSAEAALALLESCEYGTLSTVGGDGWPYGVPVSHVVIGGKIYFHCAHEGQKTDNMLREPRVCFSVVGDIRAVYDDGFTTYYESAMVFGKAAVVSDESLKRRALLALCAKYLPDNIDKSSAGARAAADIEKDFPITAVYEITPEHITGKANAPK